MNFHKPCSGWKVLLPCVGVIALGVWTTSADPAERIGSDAPHQERNLAKNDKKSALPLAEIENPAFAGKPVRKATAVKEESGSRAKAKDKKKAERQAAKDNEKAKPAAATPADRVQYDPPPDDFLGSGAPHQERGSDPNKRAARLFILER